MFEINKDYIKIKQEFQIKMRGSKLFYDIGRISATCLSIGAFNYLSFKSIYSDQLTSPLYAWVNSYEYNIGME